MLCKNLPKVKKTMSTKKKRIKIYYLLTTVTVPTPVAGDLINEIILMKALSLFADVYYNNQLFRPNKKNFGIKRLPISGPIRKYDLHYIRNNPKIFHECPEPKIWMAVPYSKNMYKKATAIATFTTAWKNSLIANESLLRKSIYANTGMSIPRKVIVFPQAYESMFKPLQSHPKTLALRKKWDADFIIGCFGRITKSCFPYSLLHIIPKLQAHYKGKKNIKIVLGGPRSGSISTPLPGITYIGQVAHNEIPYYISACDLITSNQRHIGTHYAGSRHVIEAMACGVPVISGDFRARVEMLGKNYKMYWHFINNTGRLGDVAEERILELFKKCIDDAIFYQQMKNIVLKRATRFTIPAVAQIVKNEIKTICPHV